MSVSDPRSRPVVRRRRKAADKPPMPPNLEPEAEKARDRNRRRYAQPGVDVVIEKVGLHGYRIASPHRDLEAWEAMVFDALGTRSHSAAMCFLDQLSALCTQHCLPTEGEDGEQDWEWVPDETQLNMILGMVGSIRPRNEMEAALGAQMVAVHLLTVKAAARALEYDRPDALMAAIAGKLARTFVMQCDALDRMKGRRTTKQKITVKYERHEHKHVHLDRGEQDFGGQPHEAGQMRRVGAGEPEGCAALPSPTEARSRPLQVASHARAVAVSTPRRKGNGRSQG